MSDGLRRGTRRHERTMSEYELLWRAKHTQELSVLVDQIRGERLLRDLLVLALSSAQHYHGEAYGERWDGDPPSGVDFDWLRDTYEEAKWALAHDSDPVAQVRAVAVTVFIEQAYEHAVKAGRACP